MKKKELLERIEVLHKQIADTRGKTALKENLDFTYRLEKIKEDLLRFGVTNYEVSLECQRTTSGEMSKMHYKIEFWK